MTTRSLDLGCGTELLNHFDADEVFGVDIDPINYSKVRRADLVIESIPFPDDHFDYVTAKDFLEHVPRLIYAPMRRYPFVELMNEIYRVLRIGGKFFSVTPAYPSAVAFRDPTHVNFITEETLPAYFGEGKYRWADIYGFRGAFKLIDQAWSGYFLVTTLEKTTL